MAYIELVKSGGHTYVYVVEYTGNKQYSYKKETRILGLGNTNNALLKLQMWSKNKEMIPPVIDRKDYDKIQEWIKKIKLRSVSWVY